MGEALFTTDTHRLYVGDGSLAGGQSVIDIDTGCFKWMNTGEDGQSTPTSPDPNTPSTEHQVLSLNPEMDFRIKTTKQISTSHAGTGCGTGAALAATNGGIYAHGDINSGGDQISYCSSDEELKEDILTIDKPLERIENIRGVTFTWNYLQSRYEGDDTGLLAQDVEKLDLPGITTTRDDGYKAIKYERIIPLLVECIKELKGRVQQLEKKLDE
jgi:hypothetical protein